MRIAILGAAGNAGRHGALGREPYRYADAGQNLCRTAYRLAGQHAIRLHACRGARRIHCLRYVRLGTRPPPSAQAEGRVARDNVSMTLSLSGNAPYLMTVLPAIACIRQWLSDPPFPPACTIRE